MFARNIHFSFLRKDLLADFCVRIFFFLELAAPSPEISRAHRDVRDIVEKRINSPKHTVLANFSIP